MSRPKCLQAYVSDELAARARAAASDSGLAVSEWLRTLIVRACDTLLNAMTMARFRISVERLGYEVGEIGKHGNFEAVGVPKSVREAFSSRRAEILGQLEGMASRGLAARSAANLMTRSEKSVVEDRSALVSAWKEKAQSIGFDPSIVMARANARAAQGLGEVGRLSSVVRGTVAKAQDLAAALAERFGLREGDPLMPRDIAQRSPEQVAAAHAVASALRHLSEREAAFSKVDLYRAALGFDLPAALPAIEQRVQQLLRQGALQRGAGANQGMLTTKDAVASEQRIVAAVEAGRGKVSPIIGADEAGVRLQGLSQLKYGITLNAGQEGAGRLLLSSTNRIVAVQGVAGAGKSTVLKPVADILREQGRTVLGLAVQNTLVQMLQRDTGIPSMTVARFLRRHQDLLESSNPAGLAEARAEMKGAVILLDEASMVGNADKEKLVLLANLLGVDRFASIGDRKQLGAVDAGKPFDVMQRSGVETATMNTNIRARTKGLRAAQQAAQGGRIDDALRHLGKNVAEVGEGAAIQASAAWLALAPADRERTAIYASGRALRSEVNAAVQTGLKANGELGQIALGLDVLSRVNTTREELRYAATYRPGMVAVFDRENRAQKLTKGTYTVIDSDRQRGLVTLVGAGGKRSVLRLDRLRPNGGYDPLRLFEVKRLDIHAGDRIRWTETDHKRGFINADQARITGIGQDTVSLLTSTGIAHNLPVDDPMLKRLDLAYALNAHMAQGLTSDRGIAVMDSRERNLSNQQTFLVTVTRLRDGLTLFVNDASRLGSAIARNTGMKRSALETVGRKTEQVDRESYLTTWALDEDGNTVDEVRYAGKVVGTVTTAAAPSVAPDSAKDRSTHFTYDRMGRRLTEERAGVIKASQDANGVVLKDTSGNVITATAASVIIYTYNALGEVASKQEATGDTTSYTYDTMGRMTKETDASQPVSGSSTAQTPVTQFWYDGLGNLTRSDENGRVTQYTYYASGKLKTLTNANSATRTYYYDGAGNKVAEKYLRKAGDTIYDAMTYTYDAAGRLTAQGYATVSGTTWSAIGDKTQMGYNAYGEVIGRGINLTSAQIAAGAYQDQFAYDNAGHMWRTTAGDGTVNLYVYDENGNQTLEITSSGAGLANNRVWANPTGTQTQLNLTTALNLLTNNGASSVGAIAVQGIIVTQSVYDGRNQLTQILMPMRDGTSLGNYSTSPYKTSKSYNAFGEVASEADARANAANPTNPITTNYSYNTLGKVIRRELPPVNWTAENGAIATARPTENYFYDKSGRVVGVEDANGKVNTRTLLAGTGYGKNDEALVLKEYHADGGIFERQYDRHHDMVKTINEVSKTEKYLYDDLGQLIEQDHQQRDDGTQLKDFYEYDNLGHRTLHWNSQYATLVGTTLTPTVSETTTYDIQGRVTKQIDLGGDTTSYSYAWNGNLVTTGLGTFGGWTKVTTNSSLKTRTDKTDYFGRTIDMIDYGGHNYDYTFDLAGRMVREQILSTGRDVVYAYYNTGLLQSVISTSMAMVAPLYTPTVRMVSIYKYDADNHRTFESYKKETASGGTWAGTSSGTSPNTVWIDGSWTTAPTWSATATYQNATVAWDAAGRMTAFDSTTVAGGANVNIDYEYDLVGNVRRMVSDYKGLDGDGNTVATASRQEYWYKYDEMNRFVTTKGSFAGTRGSGVIAKGSEGTNLTYDAAGNRKTATTSELLYKRIYKSNVGNLYSDTVEDWTGGGSWVNWQYLGDRKDTYVYSSDGYLSSVAITQQDLNANGTSQLTVAALDTGPGLTRSRYTRDAMGRVTDLVEYQSNGTTVAYDRSVTYNTRSQVMYEDTYTLQENQTVTHINTRYSYSAISDGQGGWKGDWSTTAGAVYMGGVVTLTKTTGDEVTSDGSTNVLDTTRSTYTFQWWGDAEQVRMDHDVDFNNTSNNIWYSARTLDESGHLVAAHIGGTGSGTDARPRDLAFINDANGQVLQRDETDYIDTTTGNPRELHYYFDGRRIGDISNNGTSNNDYASSIAARNDSGYGAFRGGANSPTAYADFDQSYDAINGLSYASTSSRYTVQGGDTLTSIAQAVWGDASFWYMIADANGLDGTETLVAGQSLILPNKVHNSHNNTSTYRVYDPNEAIGDTAPTAVAPPKKPGCGGLGAIFLAIIAVVVVAIVAPELIGQAATFVAGTGPAGVVATQATGLTALFGGAAAASVGAAAVVTGGALAGAIGSIVSQGIGVATGLQDRFSWKSVGMAALGGAVGGALGKFNAFGSGAKGLGAVGNSAVRGAVSNALIQGVGVATGLQDRFDWTWVAAASMGAGATNVIGGAGFVQSMGGLGQGLSTNMAGSIANAATRSLIDGTDFGDNIMAALPDVIANTVGNLVADAVASKGKPSAPPKVVEGPVSEIEAAQVAPTSGTSAQSPLTFDEKQHLLEEALPIAKENIKGYETSELLTPEEREDVNRAGRQLRRGDNQIVFEAIPGIVDGTARYINGVAKITVDTEASGLFNPDNTVNMPVLENILAHEAIHIDDNRWFGLDSGPTTMAQSRRTERNAYRTGVAIDKANGITNYVTDPSTRATVILTRETSTFAAERSVQKWVDAYNGSIPRYNLSADANNRANRDYNAWARKNGKAQVISYPRTPITYSPPKSYLASTDSYGNSR